MRLLGMVAWVGGLIFFAFVVAPVAFHVLPSAHEAGLVVGGTLRYLHWIGLIGGAAVRTAGVTGPLRNAVLIGVDLGPNLSVNGSLATILWLIAIRREGQDVGFRKFLKWGALVMPPALALAILTVLL